MADGRIAANKKRQKISDEQILEDIALGLTRQEIAGRHGVHVENLAKRMKRLGVHAKYAQLIGRPREKLDWHYNLSTAKTVKKHLGCNFEYLSHKGTTYKLKCNTCGDVFERGKKAIQRGTVICKKCRDSEKAIHEGREKLIQVLYAIAENKKTKKCKICGNEYHSQYINSVYCSPKCRKKRQGSSIKKRCRTYGAYYDPNVTPIKVFKRDNYVCKICGLKCNTEDNSWTKYVGPYSPTVDHIIALKNGGQHTWDNVQCAHAICNSYKRDLLTV